MDQPYIATVFIWAPNFAPRNYAYCAGQLMAISQNTALFSLIGTVYGGDGRTTFALPDLRSRIPVGAGMGAGPGLSFYPLGAMAGQENVTLMTTQMPIHNHSAQGEVIAHNTQATSAVPQTGESLANPNFGSGIDATAVNTYAPPNGAAVQLAPGSVSVQIGNNGGSQPHENRQPFLGISFIIALFGIFPPRS